jgi:hypothetical protein
MQMVDFRLAFFPGRRLIVVLGWRTTHGPIGVPEKIAIIVIHVVLLCYIRALNGAEFESKVGSAIHCWTADVTEELRTIWVCGLGAGAKEGAGAVGAGWLGGMGNLESVHMRKGARKDFPGRRSKEIHLVIVDLWLS